MKHRGNEDYYKSYRDKELMAAYKMQLWENGGCGLATVFSNVVQTPTSRFFVTSERATIVVSKMLKGLQPRLSRMNKMMYEEIYRRVKPLLPLRVGTPLCKVIEEVINKPAPRFYITPASAAIIIHGLKKKWKRERKTLERSYRQ